jgi:putative tryptophan/tyrosine transport system substrate-binding protein
VRRRAFIGLLGGVALAPLAARAQQPGRMRRIGVLLGATTDDPVLLMYMAAFRQGLEHLGWSDGRNVTFDYRWAGGDRDLIRKYAADLVALKPDVILTNGSGNVGPLQQATRTLPIVFAGIVDAVAGGFARHCRRGDRIEMLFAAVHESGFGPKPTCRRACEGLLME